MEYDIDKIILYHKHVKDIEINNNDHYETEYQCTNTNNQSIKENDLHIINHPSNNIEKNEDKINHELK